MKTLTDSMDNYRRLSDGAIVPLTKAQYNEAKDQYQPSPGSLGPTSVLQQKRDQRREDDEREAAEQNAQRILDENEKAAADRQNAAWEAEQKAAGNKNPRSKRAKEENEEADAKAPEKARTVAVEPPDEKIAPRQSTPSFDREKSSPKPSFGPKG